LTTYQNSLFKRRSNGVLYVSKDKKIKPNELGALPLNVLSEEINILPKNIKNSLLTDFTNIVYGAVSGKSEEHQAVQPEYISKKYILACTEEGDLVLDP